VNKLLFFFLDLSDIRYEVNGHIIMPVHFSSGHIAYEYNIEGFMVENRHVNVVYKLMKI